MDTWRDGGAFPRPGVLVGDGLNRPSLEKWICFDSTVCHIWTTDSFHLSRRIT